MPRIHFRRACATLLLAGFVIGCAHAASSPAAPADFSGLWIPVAGSSDALATDKVRMTDRASAALAAFDPRHHDSTHFCMPYGTPRNTLSTAPYPMEILQRPERLTMI